MSDHPHEGDRPTTDQKLRVLLPHWVEHNTEHATEFRQWAERAREAGQAEVAEEIDLAAKQLGWVNEALRAAMDRLDAPL
jgi:hypothetical protein